MVRQASAGDHPVDVVLTIAYSWTARDSPLLLGTVSDLEEAGIEVISMLEKSFASRDA